MYHDSIRLTDTLTGHTDLSHTALRIFVETIESLSGGKFVIPAQSTLLGRAELAPLFELKRTLENKGMLKDTRPILSLPDEPRLYGWSTQFAPTESAGGFSIRNECAALAAALAEGVERGTWYFERDFFRKEVYATSLELKKPYLTPTRFAGFSNVQRTQNTPITFSPENTLLWITGYSWIQSAEIFVPAQIVSRAHAATAARNKSEPRIRPSVTTGLATAPTRTEALARGVLEVIERDAYMISWLNQLTLPRIDMNELMVDNPSLAALVDSCVRYNLRVDFVRLLTDAPAYVLCAMISDGAHMPALSIGLSAHAKASHAAEKALLEALQIRQSTRSLMKKKLDINPLKPTQSERAMYWATSEHLREVAFWIDAPKVKLTREAWENDTPAEHFARIRTWCVNRAYELVSVSLTHSKRNSTPWYIEFVIIPELQPMHLDERWPCVGGDRLLSVPRLLGYTPRRETFSIPHPFV